MIGGNAFLDEDGTGQVFVACVIEGGIVLTDFFQYRFQISTTNRTAAGDEAGGVIAGGNHEFVVFER